jgi:hypothetical protein
VVALRSVATHSPAEKNLRGEADLPGIGGIQIPYLGKILYELPKILGLEAGYNAHSTELIRPIWAPKMPWKRPSCQFTQGKRDKFLISNSYALPDGMANWESGLSYCPEGYFFRI